MYAGIRKMIPVIETRDNTDHWLDFCIGHLLLVYALRTAVLLERFDKLAPEQLLPRQE